MNWMKYRGESYLETPIVVATSLSMAQQLRRDFQTEFYGTAKVNKLYRNFIYIFRYRSVILVHNLIGGDRKGRKITARS